MKQTRLMQISFVVALVAMLGSLYYGYFGDPMLALSDGLLWDTAKGLPPCEMCRYARIMMYPIVVTSVIALITKEIKGITLIQIILSGLGAFLMVYLYGMQKRGRTSPTCDRRAAVSCYDISVDYFGFITIPLLALIAFVVLFVLGALAYKASQK